MIVYSNAPFYAANCRFVATLHNGTTPAQRQHAADKLRSWEADLRLLAAERR